MITQMKSRFRFVFIILFVMLFVVAGCTSTTIEVDRGDIAVTLQPPEGWPIIERADKESLMKAMPSLTEEQAEGFMLDISSDITLLRSLVPGGSLYDEGFCIDAANKADSPRFMPELTELTDASEEELAAYEESVARPYQGGPLPKDVPTSRVESGDYLWIRCEDHSDGFVGVTYGTIVHNYSITFTYYDPEGLDDATLTQAESILDSLQFSFPQ